MWRSLPGMVMLMLALVIAGSASKQRTDVMPFKDEAGAAVPPAHGAALPEMPGTTALRTRTR